ncbi:glycosyltransferase family 28 protein [Enterococcus faecalis 13-SD-W-01]|nr:glycosyltransferase family 28 protein [Enterococcus faecalis 13-SD-W-01]
MIFVTVGTHEQSFERLIKKMDQLKASGKIKEDVFIQTGFTSYEPKACEFRSIISFEEMNAYMEKADIIITHGGPATFMMALEKGKIPIVVPRQYRFHEHVNDHQVDFAKKVAAEMKNILVVEEMDELEEVINTYDRLSETMMANHASHNPQFIQDFKKIANQLVGG